MKDVIISIPQKEAVQIVAKLAKDGSEEALRQAEILSKANAQAEITTGYNRIDEPVPTLHIILQKDSEDFKDFKTLRLLAHRAKEYAIESVASNGYSRLEEGDEGYSKNLGYFPKTVSTTEIAKEGIHGRTLDHFAAAFKRLGISPKEATYILGRTRDHVASCLKEEQAGRVGATEAPEKAEKSYRCALFADKALQKELPQRIAKDICDLGISEYQAKKFFGEMKREIRHAMEGRGSRGRERAR